MLEAVVELVGSWLGGSLGANVGPRGRLRAYRKGEPVFIPATFEGTYPWANELLCHGPRLWVVSNRRFENEKRIEIQSQNRVLDVDRKVGWSTSPSVGFTLGRETLRVGSMTDFELLVEAAEAWSRAEK